MLAFMLFEHPNIVLHLRLAHQMQNTLTHFKFSNMLNTIFKFYSYWIKIKSK
jgi:hypothetical protein